MPSRLVERFALVVLVIIAAAAVWLVIRLETGMSVYSDRALRTFGSQAIEIGDRDMVETFDVRGVGITTEVTHLVRGLWEAELEVDAAEHGGVTIEAADGRSTMSWGGEPLIFAVGDFGEVVANFGEAQLYPGDALVKVGANNGVSWTLTLRRFGD